VRRVFWTTAALVAAVVVLIGLSLPPARLAPASGVGDGAAAGVVHVHTNRSDGRSSPDEVAAAAARAGLAFVIFTDHGDATRKPDPPMYRSGVLCLDAVEISTVHGHLLALGLPQAPYPFGGEARDVLEDVHRLGGIGFAAHPDSPKTDLEWRAWSASIDGVELINLDTAWRVIAGEPGWRPKARLARALATYPVRPAETIASLIAEHGDLRARWDALGAERRVPMLVGVDAHARLAMRETHDNDNRFSLALPGYEAVFRTLTMRALPERPLTGEAAADAELIVDAIGRGRAYASVDALLAPASFAFSASGGSVQLQQGDEGTVEGPVTLTVRSNAPPSFTTTVLRNGDVIATRPASPEMSVAGAAGPAVYRVEIRATDRPGAPVWIVSNPIYVRAADSLATPAAPASVTAAPRLRARDAAPPLVLFDDRGSVEWHTEVSPASKAAIDITRTATGREMLVRFGLPGGPGRDEFAAAVADTTGAMSGRFRISFTVRSTEPMRLSIQLRVPQVNGGGERWQRSVYVEGTDTTHTLAFDDFTLPLGRSGPTVDAAAVHGVLFTVDRMNTAPGTSGRFWLTDVRVE
jgi:hypothetical protein